MAVRRGRPLNGVVVVEDGQEVTRSFADETGAEAMLVGSSRNAAEARAVAGAWSDLDGEKMSEALDRIRRASPPTLPLDEP